MLFPRVIGPGLLLPVLLSRVLLSAAAPAQRGDSDPCATIAGLSFVDPADAMACQMSFSYDENLKYNVMSVVAGVLEFYTFEDFYSNSPAPFNDSTVDIPGEISRINGTQYSTDYDFNMDLWDFTTLLHDGHTRWIPNCYTPFQNILPAPVVFLDKGVFIAPNTDVLFDQYGSDFAAYFAAKGFDWKPYAGAEVQEIGGLSALDYIDQVASTASGNYLDHNIRVNNVIGNYQLNSGNYSQRLGDLASSPVLRQTSLNFSVITMNSTSGTPESIDVPFVAAYYGPSFTDGQSYWNNNCAATDTTNTPGTATSKRSASGGLHKTAGAIAGEPDLPSSLTPTIPESSGSNDLMKTYVLPGNKTGVMYIGTFDTASDAVAAQFPSDVKAALDEFTSSGVTNLMIDVSNNPGGRLCLGLQLYQYLNSEFDFGGFQATSRANTLSQKILKSDIAQGLNDSVALFTADNFLFLNGTQIPSDFNYNDPPAPYTINGVQDPTSQRCLGKCLFDWSQVIPGFNGSTTVPPPIDPNNIVIVGNGACASTCAHFTTLMYEQHQTKIATFGGHPDLPMEYKGTAGLIVLPWANLNNEIKIAGVKNDPLAPPDLLVNAQMPVNLLTAYSALDENTPIEYYSEPSQYRYPYTTDTFNNPQNMWSYVESQFFA